MDKKRWILTAVVVTVVVTVLEWVFNTYFLGNAYATTATIWRPTTDMSRMMPYGWVTTLFVSFLLIYIYNRGYEGKGSALTEGLRFGLIIGLFTALPTAVWSYIMIPMTLTIAAGWFVISMVDMLVAGAIIGTLYKPTRA